jgi:hypothetical protein
VDDWPSHLASENQAQSSPETMFPGVSTSGLILPDGTISVGTGGPLSANGLYGGRVWLCHKAGTCSMEPCISTNHIQPALLTRMMSNIASLAKLTSTAHYRLTFPQPGSRRAPPRNVGHFIPTYKQQRCLPPPTVVDRK